MIIDERNCSNKINALTYHDWQPLLALIPEIENTSKFAERADDSGNVAGVTQMPHFVAKPVVSQFLEIICAIPIIIGFDWGSWDEGRKIAGDKDFDFDTIDLVTKCKLITAIVRNDRFCEGALVSAFESGLILKILKSIEKKVNTKSSR